jgi:hypothetical protein
MSATSRAWVSSSRGGDGGSRNLLPLHFHVFYSTGAADVFCGAGRKGALGYASGNFGSLGSGVWSCRMQQGASHLDERSERSGATLADSRFGGYYARSCWCDMASMVTSWTS